MSQAPGIPRRGEVYWVDFSAARGGEISKTRPAIIVSNDVSNQYTNRVQIVPVTTNTSRIYPSEAVVQLAGRANKAMANQITTATKELAPYPESPPNCPHDDPLVRERSDYSDARGGTA